MSETPNTPPSGGNNGNSTLSHLFGLTFVGSCAGLLALDNPGVRAHVNGALDVAQEGVKEIAIGARDKVSEFVTGVTIMGSEWSREAIQSWQQDDNPNKL